MKKFTDISEYFRKVPIPFLIAIVSVLALVLFIPKSIAETLAVYDFRNQFRVFLGPTLLLAIFFLIARGYIFQMDGVKNKKRIKKQQLALHKLTAEEKGYLILYLHGQNSIYVGLEDGIMGGLLSKNIVYRTGSTGSVFQGFAFNINPWAREYLEKHQELLDGAIGEPLTPEEKTFG